MAGVAACTKACACETVFELGMSTRTVTRKTGIGGKGIGLALLLAWGGVDLGGSVSQLSAVTGQGGG